MESNPWDSSLIAALAWLGEYTKSWGLVVDPHKQQGITKISYCDNISGDTDRVVSDAQIIEAKHLYHVRAFVDDPQYVVWNVVHITGLEAVQEMVRCLKGEIDDRT